MPIAAHRAGALVASVEFRLAPAHPFPAALEDCVAALRWLAEHGSEVGGDPERLALCGRISGGNLAAATALAARDRGGSPLAAQALLLPATNHTFDTASYHQLAVGDGLIREDGTQRLTRAAMIVFWDRYLANPEDGADPYASPLRAPDLTGIAPALIVTAQRDPLRDDGEAYAARLRSARVPVQAIRYLDATHGFLAFAATVSSADHALSHIAGVLRTVLAR